jgi:hypothetical protein
MNTLARRALIACAAIGLLAATSVAAEPAAKPTTAVVVDIPIPPGATRAMLDKGIMASIPSYRDLPGLIYKYFTVSDAKTFGGVYIWKSRTDAEAHFDAAWKAKVLKTYGAEPHVSYYDVVTTTDGPAGR